MVRCRYHMNLFNHTHACFPSPPPSSLRPDWTHPSYIPVCTICTGPEALLPSPHLLQAGNPAAAQQQLKEAVDAQLLLLEDEGRDARVG